MLVGKFDSFTCKDSVLHYRMECFCGPVRGAKELPAFLTSVTLFEEVVIRLVRKWKRLDTCNLTCVT